MLNFILVVAAVLCVISFLKRLGSRSEPEDTTPSHSSSPSRSATSLGSSTANSMREETTPTPSSSRPAAPQNSAAANQVRSEEKPTSTPTSSEDVDAARRKGWRYDRLLPYNKENQQEAFKWYEIAAKGGDKDAMYLLGCKYLSLWPGKKDPQKALEWFEKSASLGCASAHCAAGLCYKYGYGTEQNYFKAFKYLESSLMWDYRSIEGDWCAIQDGFIARSLFHLAECHEKGWGCEKNTTAALSLYQEAAQHGYVYAIERAEELTGKRSRRRDLSREQEKRKVEILHKWRVLEEDEVKRQARNGDADAQFVCAKDAYNDENYAEACRWALSAAQSGNVHAMSLLGEIYNNIKEYTSAVRWYTQAADKGYIDAYYGLVDIYLYGEEGVPRDEARAYQYQRYAAENGCTTAQ